MLKKFTLCLFVFFLTACTFGGSAGVGGGSNGIGAGISLGTGIRF